MEEGGSATNEKVNHRPVPVEIRERSYGTVLIAYCIEQEVANVLEVFREGHLSKATKYRYHDTMTRQIVHCVVSELSVNASAMGSTLGSFIIYQGPCGNRHVLSCTLTLQYPVRQYIFVQ